MKKVLILTAGYGEGHNTAARNLHRAMNSVAGGTVDAKVLDLLEITYGRVNDLLKKAYMTAISRAPILWESIYGMIDSSGTLEDWLTSFAPLRHAMEALLTEERPDAVVCTFPVYLCLIEAVYRDRPRPFPLMTVVTDSITINAIWHRCDSDAFVVANEETAEVIRNAGVPGGKVHVLGFPVSPRFAGLSAEKAPPQASECWRILYLPNGSARDHSVVIAQALANLPNVKLTVSAGRDVAWGERMSATLGEEVEIVGWTERMPEIMNRAHLIVGKAGGATVQESLAAGTPMVMTKVIPGQEEGNARLLLDNGCGALARTPEEIAQAVESAFAAGGLVWSRWHANVLRLSRPDAAAGIARFMLERIEAPGVPAF